MSTLIRKNTKLQRYMTNTLRTLRRQIPPFTGSRTGKTHGSHSGMTLVEILIAMAVMGMACMAGLSAMLFSYRVADANLRTIAANAIAQSVAEQITTIDYETLGNTILPVDVPSLPDGTITPGVWVTRTDDIHNTPGVTSDDLVMTLRIQVIKTTAAGFKCAQVIIDYTWQENSFFAPHTRTGTMTVVRSSVGTF